MSPNSPSAFAGLQFFARDVKSKAALGERFNAQPEDHLKMSVANLVTAVGEALGLQVEAVPEARVDDVGGRPDLAVTVDGLLVGYIELKAPGVGTTDRELKGRNKTQLRRFLNLPNLIYTDARDWTFYREGVRQKTLDVRLGNVDQMGDDNLAENNAKALTELLREFLGWEPIVPTNPRALAEQLAPMTQVIRTDVAVGVDVNGSALEAIYADWQRTLFPNATPDEFADSYAQTLTYGLLLAKLSGASALDTRTAAEAIQRHSSLLSRTLEILTQPGTAEELGPGLRILERTIEAVDPAALRSDGQDPWLYFYEDFLAVYDPKLRNERGVYYTPAQVVKAQVNLVDELLRTKLGKSLGVADKNVTVLDPAVGTGTYLLRTLQQGLETVSKSHGEGAAAGIATQMAQNLYGFEMLVGPYAVAYLRMTQAIHEAKGIEPKEGVNIYLTDTLESPFAKEERRPSYWEQPLAEEHRKARKVKLNSPILVCIGNPPYEREQRRNADDPSPDIGGWIRNEPRSEDGGSPFFEDFLAPARKAGMGGYLQPIFNLYAYFWRWALWKVFETQDGPGIVAFISASSYLKGPGFVGMREEMRRTFDELWIIDLEGGGRGTRVTENVFDIRTPVAIAIGVRYGTGNREVPATVHYSRITGTRTEKLAILDATTSFADIEWEKAHTNWMEPLTPEAAGDYFQNPSLQQIMPWDQAGCMAGRTWVIDSSQDVLRKRWSTLVESKPSERSSMFKNSRTGRKARDTVTTRLDESQSALSIVEEPSDARVPAISRYGFRSFDRQWIFSDSRLLDRHGPTLWTARSDRQIFLTTILAEPISDGPAITTSPYVPDLHHFRGSLGGRAFPLYRDAAATQPNVTKGLLDLLGKSLGIQVGPEDIVGYIVGVLGHPGYVAKFNEELEVTEPLLPLTKSQRLFSRAVLLGKQVVAWQTYADRFPEALGTSSGVVPNGTAKIKSSIPGDKDKYPFDFEVVRYDYDANELNVGEGVFERVDPQIWEYQVSGMQVVRSWIGYRLHDRSGNRSSSLDDIRPETWTWEMNKELLELLWVLEGVISLESAQKALLDEIMAEDLFLTDELPSPTDAERAAPRVERQQQLGLDLGV